MIYLTHLVHLGYLVYKNEKGTVYISYKEMPEEFNTYTRNEEQAKFIEIIKNYKSNIET